MEGGGREREGGREGGDRYVGTIVVLGLAFLCPLHRCHAPAPCVAQLGAMMGLRSRCGVPAATAGTLTAPTT